MDFKGACKYLEKLVSYEKMPDFKYDAKNFDLSRFKKFIKNAGIDYSGIKFVHVAGSKGKGSVCGLIEKYMRAKGLSVGLFTSPHMFDLRERIVVDGKMIEKKVFAKYVTKIKIFIEKNSIQITYFEFLTAIALKYFVDKNVKYAVLEVGLGGRLDSTNIVTPILSVLTRVEMEHVGILGNNLKEILDEKLGIVKPNVSLLIGEQSDEVYGLLKKKLKSRAKVFYVKMKSFDEAKIINGRTAYFALKIMFGKVDKKLFESVFKKFQLVGRFDIRRIHGKIVVFDIAHTKDSIKNLTESLKKKFPKKKFVFLVSVMKGKNVEAILRIIGNASKKVVFTSSYAQRGYSGEELEKIFENMRDFIGSRDNTKIYEDCKKAFCQCLTGQAFDEIMVVTGSHFLVSRILSSSKIIL